MRFLVPSTSLCRNDKNPSLIVTPKPSTSARDGLREESHLSGQG